MLAFNLARVIRIRCAISWQRFAWKAATQNVIAGAMIDVQPTLNRKEINVSFLTRKDVEDIKAELDFIPLCFVEHIETKRIPDSLVKRSLFGD